MKCIAIDDEPLALTQLSDYISQVPFLSLVKSCQDAFEAMKILSEEEVDLIFVDINMPDLNGIDTTTILSKQYPEIKIIALSSYNSLSFIKKMLSVGVVCYIPKSFSPTDLIFRIKEVNERGFYYEKNILDNFDSLGLNTIEISEREKEVLQLICQQKSASEIAELLSISSRTVDNHRNSLLQNTNSKNVIGLVVFAIQNHLFLTEK